MASVSARSAAAGSAWTGGRGGGAEGAVAAASAIAASTAQTVTGIVGTAGIVSRACYPRRVAGQLLVVATPLGNLDDISPRALAVLREATAIACEDTRRTAKLLARYAIERPLLSCHRFNERSRLEPIL